MQKESFDEPIGSIEQEIARVESTGHHINAMYFWPDSKRWAVSIADAKQVLGRSEIESLAKAIRLAHREVFFPVVRPKLVEPPRFPFRPTLVSNETLDELGL